MESTNSTPQADIDYIYSDGTDVFYNSISKSLPPVPGSQDTVVSSIKTGLDEGFSTVHQYISSTDYIHLAYVSTANTLYYERYDGDWDYTATSVTNSDDLHPSFSEDSGTNDLYLTWVEDVGDGEYELFDRPLTYSTGPSWSWGTKESIVTVDSAGDQISNNTSTYSSNGKLMSLATFDTTSPYHLGTNLFLDTSGNNAPTVSSVVVNGSSNIDLTENTTTNISWTATITDTDGYGEIDTVTGKLYRSGAVNADQCTENDNNCYADSDCSLSGCSGNTCTATCTVAMYFHADATDTNSAQPSEYWRGWMEATDTETEDGDGYSPVNVPDVNSLAALDIQTTLSYGAVEVGTSSAEQTTLVTNTGNVTIDTIHSGSDMCTDYPTCSGTSISVGDQEYSDDTFTYGEGTSLSGSTARLQLNLVKSTDSPANSTKNVYWRILISGGIPTGAYSGKNVVTSVHDSL